MKKSLGNKRNKLGEGPDENEPDHIGDITRAYGKFKKSDRVKIFKGTDFAYRKITVERALRLRFCIDDAGLERLQAERIFQGLSESKKKGAAGSAELQLGRVETRPTSLSKKAARAAEASVTYQTSSAPNASHAELELGAPGGGAPGFRNREQFLAHLKPILKAVEREAGSKIPTNLHKCILNALSQRDESADICCDKAGKPEADTSLRDTENVPWDDNIDAYMAREVLPHVPDAWVDHSKTKVGFEIPFTRHFYEYQPLRPLAEIEAEIKQLEAEILGMLGEVVG